jgi:mannose-P-dolichol utilization defect protein 1
MDALKSVFARLYSKECAETYLTKGDLMDPACFKLFASKSLGYGIIAGSLVLKVPQILKLRGGNSPP